MKLFVLITLIVIIVIIIVMLYMYSLLNNKQLSIHNKEFPVYSKQLPIHVISLKRSLDRRQRLNSILENIKYSIFDAVDGKNDDITELKNKHVVENTLTAGQIGCFLSHLLLWKKLVEIDNSDNFLILEDDIHIKPFFNKFIMLNEKHYPKDFDIMFLGHCSESKGEKIQTMYNYDLYKSISPRCTHAYIVSKNGMKKIINYFDNNKVDLPIDEIIYGIRGLNSFSFFPSIVDQDWQLENEND